MGMRRVAVAAVVVMLSGCPFGDDDGDPANYVAFDQIPAAYKDAYCTYLAKCGFFPDKATCLSAELTPSYTPYALSDQVIASIGAGRIRYNGSKVKACFDAIAANTCDRTDEDGRATVPECRQLITGLVGADGACYADLECVSTYCAGNSEAPCTAGKCVGDTPPASETPAQLGQSCSSGQECARGLYCDPMLYRCAALKIDGAQCVDPSECAYGLGCSGTTTRTCKQLPTVGLPCPEGICRDDGTYCATMSTPTGMTSTCTQVGLAGAQCNTAYAQCSQYYQCDYTTSTCGELPRIGESCSSSSRCFDADAYCDPTSYTCMAGRPDGSPCNSSLECASDACTGLVCGEMSYTCP